MAKRKKGKSVEAPQVEAPTSTAVEEIDETSSGSEMVMVALNRAQGIQFRVNGHTVEVAGNSVHMRGLEHPGALPVGEFGLTMVAAEDWREIERQFGKTALFRSGRIFAASGKGDAVREARSRRDTRHGLEPAKTVSPAKATEPAQV